MSAAPQEQAPPGAWGQAVAAAAFGGYALLGHLAAPPTCAGAFPAAVKTPHACRNGSDRPASPAPGGR